jgi:hypothetical protein
MSFDDPEIVLLDDAALSIATGDEDVTVTVPDDSSLEIQVFALGLPGAAGPLPWTLPSEWTATRGYVAGPPASLVTQSGAAYVCATTHTAGVFAEDLEAGKWALVLTSGDMLKATYDPDGTGVFDVAHGGTGATTPAGARTALGISVVGSTGSYSDLTNKPTLGTAAAHAVGTSGVAVPLLSTANTWSLAQTFTAAPVFTDAPGARTALGVSVVGSTGSYSDLTNKPTLGTAAAHAVGTSGASVPLLSSANTWSLAQTFTAAPVFTDAPGARTALGITLGTAAGNVVQLDGSGRLPAVDGSQLTGITAGTPGRTLLTADRTYYVRGDGADTNNGLANTSDGAFLTINKAVDTVAALDIGVFDVLIQVADGTYTTPVVLKTIVGSGSVTIQGNITTPANVLISTTNTNAITGANIIGKWVIRGVKLVANTAGSSIEANGPSVTIMVGNVDFGAALGGGHLRSVNGGTLQFDQGYKISGPALMHYFASGMSSLGANTLSAITVTIIGTPDFHAAFAYIQRNSLLDVRSSAVTFSGAVTGARYYASSNGVIYTEGSGTSYFPGSGTGSTESGGQYL